MFLKSDYLTKICQLQPEDEVWRKDFLEAIASKEISSVEKLLERIPDMTIVIRLAEHDELIKAVCLHPQLKLFWQEAWRLCGHFPAPQDRSKIDSNTFCHDMLPEQNSASFDLVRGMYFYSSANFLLEENQKKLTAEIRNVFEKASECGSFYADYELVKFHIDQCELQDHLSLAEGEFLSAKNIATRSEQKHAVPGMMLVFYVEYRYVQKLSSFLEKQKESVLEEDKNIVQKMMVSCQEALSKANAARDHYLDRLNEVQNYTPWNSDGLPEYLFKPSVAIETIQAFSNQHHTGRSSRPSLPSSSSALGWFSATEPDVGVTEERGGIRRKAARTSPMPPVR